MIKTKELQSIPNDIMDLTDAVKLLMDMLGIQEAGTLGDRAMKSIKFKIDNDAAINTIMKSIKHIIVNVKGYSLEDYKKIYSIIRDDNQKSLTNLLLYLQNPLELSYFRSLNVTTKICKVISEKYNISSDILCDIFRLVGDQKSGKGVGRGEIFLGLFINKATNAFVGDLYCEGQIDEVKANDARMMSQNGFGLGRTALYSFFEKVELEYPKVFSKFFKDTKNNIQSYNLKRDCSSTFYDIFRLAAKLDILNKIINIVVNTVYTGRSGLWPHSSKDIKKLILSAIKDNVKSDGNPISNTDLNYGLFHSNILYYKSQNEFDGIFFVNHKNCTIIYMNFSKHGLEFLEENITYTQNSFQDNPTSPCYKSKLK